MLGRDFRLLVVWTSVALLGQPSAHAFRKPAQPPPSIPFDLSSDCLIVVRGSAGPLKDLNLLVDTGTSPTVLNQRLAARLHLSAQPARIAVPGGIVQGAMTTLPSLDLGPIHKDNLPVLVRDLSALQLPIPLDGIIGLDVLGQDSFVIDYASRRITFGLTPSASATVALKQPATVPLTLVDGLPIVDVTINHTSAHLVLDTGAPALVLFGAAPNPAPQSPKLVRTALPQSLGRAGRRSIRLAGFQLGPSDFGRQPAFLVPDPAGTTRAYDGLLSPSALSITQLAIDVTHHTLTFTRTP